MFKKSVKILNRLEKVSNTYFMIRLSTLSILILLILGATNLHSQYAELNPIRDPNWVNKWLDSLSLEEKIGQLFMIRAHSDKGPEHIKEVERQIKKYHVGGLCFFQGTPTKQTELTNRYQKLSKIPLMVSMDAEWGLGMRFKEDAISFPRQLTLGAIQDNRLIYDMGKEIAKQCRRIGTHINFAPVIDINNNPGNPVIGNRSFGEDRYNVSAKGYHYMMGMQEEKVMASAKHFPGHGDTDVDSHLDLPVINHSRARLDSVELYPFRVLVDKGVQSLMIAHLQVPALEPTENLPTSLSYNVVGRLIRQEMNYDGLIFTDALEMKGVTKHYGDGEVELKSLMAGNDILLLPEDIDKAFAVILESVKNGTISEERINQSVMRILKGKYDLELDNYVNAPMTNLKAEVNNKAALGLKATLIENALTLVRNQNELLPIKDVKERKFASIAIGAKSITPFQKRMDAYAKVKHVFSPKEISQDKAAALLNEVSGHEIVFVSFHDMSRYAKKDFGITQSSIDFINMLSQQRKVIVTIFGSPYSLKFFDNNEWVFVAYEDDKMTQDLSAQALFGVNSIKGRLPITASPRSRYGDGLDTKSILRMGYSIPERVGMRSDSLAKIAKLAKDIIRRQAAPGCQVIVVKDRKVVYNEAFGYQTYSKKKPVNTKTSYDLASITKVAATTMSVMKLVDEGRIDINATMGTYFPETINTNKENLVIKDVMAHHARLIGWLPFYRETITANKKDPRPMWKYYRKTQDEIYDTPVARNLFMDGTYQKEMWKQLFETNLRSNYNYRYSDLGFIMMKQIIKNQSGREMDEYLSEEVYSKMGLQSTMYNPWKRGSISQIPPSENDNYFRRAKVQGYVHDMAAAMFGGVSGHAGLFSNAEDLAKLFQMLLNGGYYGGINYVENHTIKEFTTRHPSSSRRGIGFDMRQMNPDQTLNMAEQASEKTFGHLGFTGTCVWADPEENLIFIFLSNRTYPTMRKNLLNRDNYRKRIQSIVYNSIIREGPFLN